ncbi:hypothetical protein CONPUDRAFT_155478 [Coniophora puteana RWD-64-598 SS2]|uniref:Uncharacterized protein n=1 Tax=Coniophora puteana (strain RWD-64-598) TaxID=741705 RepID=A0A5M3MLS6_CONPW|nr:uncharacterized protein CONPUDRAFT_155478 [Coniophora puteana RWD-64-598 SS2]EIW80118.1 hypothetical protein CONPUDRAFT_155478 [Coniophora puteana RWD-64-598 SS2]
MTILIDLINIIAVTKFGVEHYYFNEHDQSAWSSLCSPTSDISFSALCTGSGLTCKQYSLITINIILFSYLALGSLIIIFLMELSFINTLFPTTSSTHIFTCLYSAFGIINIAMAVGLFYKTVLEGFKVGTATSSG